MDKLPFLQGSVLGQFGDADSEPQLWEVSPAKLPPLGRVLSTLLSAESKDLRKAISQTSGKTNHGPLAKAISALLLQVKVLVQNESSLELVAVPLLEQVVKSKDHISRKPGFCLLRLLLGNKAVGRTFATQFSGLIDKDGTDNRVRLGWCLVVRELIQSGSIGSSSEPSGDKTGLELDILLLFASCIPQLVHLVCHASVAAGKQKVPTRLTTAAADCTLVITKALASGPDPLNVPNRNLAPIKSEKRLITIVDSDPSNCPLDVDPLGDDEQPTCSGTQERRERLLWDQLDNLVALVAELHEWNVVSRPLHTAGLQQVQQRLQALANFRDSLRSHEGGETDLKIGMSVLAACWQKFSSFMIFESQVLSRNPEQVLQESMSALQYCSEEDLRGYQNEETMAQGKRKADDMRRFALACLALVLGRLGPRQLDSALAEIEPHLVKLLLGQLRCGDAQGVDLSVAILSAVLFRSVPSETPPDSASSPMCRLEGLIPSLMELLDVRDSAARAVVLLVSKFFAANPGSSEMELLFKRLDSPESVQRRNALDVLGEVLSMTTQAADVADSILSKTLAGHLLSRLGDEELTNRVEASALFAKLEPRIVLPALVRSVFSADGRVRSSASSAILSLLKSQATTNQVVCMLLDCITNLSECSMPPIPPQAEASNHSAPENSAILNQKPLVDMDRIMNLIPGWAVTVQDWEPVTTVLLNKMVAEPSNPVLPRFFSQISPFLIGMAHVIFPHVIDVTAKQRMLGGDVLTKDGEVKSWEADGGVLARELFQRLNPLLVLKVLPLEMFNDKENKYLYGNLLLPTAYSSAQDSCIASLLLWRMKTTYEFREVRKLAAELTGRLVPEIVIPQMSIQLKEAATSRNLQRIRACIYALCNAFLLRGRQLLFYQEIPTICCLLTSVLMWASGDEAVMKTQHGCIDCFAVMMLAELAPAEQVSDADGRAEAECQQIKEQKKIGTDLQHVSGPKLAELTSNRRKLDDEIGTKAELGRVPPLLKLEDNDEPKSIDEVTVKPKLIEVIVESRLIEGVQEKRSASDKLGGLTRVCGSVIGCLTGQVKHVPFRLPENYSKETLALEELLVAPIPLRLCMANAIISACQKVPIKSRLALAQVVVPSVMQYIKDGSEAVIIAACLQVLFSAVYHLKAPAVLPYSSDLLRIAMTVIRGSGPSEVRVGAVKVLTALLASEKAIIKELAASLMEAQSVLASVARMDTSAEMRSLCEKLFGCITTPGINLV